jgi:hypothetical protein
MLAVSTQGGDDVPLGDPVVGMSQAVEGEENWLSVHNPV